MAEPSFLERRVWLKRTDCQQGRVATRAALQQRIWQLVDGLVEDAEAAGWFAEDLWEQPASLRDLGKGR